VIEASGAAVVCLTAEATADEREEILRAGAVRLVEKGGTVDGLADAIRGAVPG
jgi:DNA-binding NarL/FixJ family response regulator